MTEPQLCVTVTGRTMEELRRARDAASNADLVELRLDLVDRPDVAGALEGRRTPVIVTCRATWEGGGFAGTEEERRRILAEAAAPAPSSSTSRRRPGFVRLHRLAPRPRHRAVVARVRRAALRPARARAAMRSTGAEVDEARDRGDDARRDAAALRPRGRADVADEPDRRPRAARDGAAGRPDARAGRAAGQPVDLRGRRRRARPDAGGASSARVPVPPHPPRRRALRRRRQPDHAFAVAGDAQRRLRGARLERGVRAARGARRRRLRRLRDAHGRARREHHGPVQGRRCRARTRSMPSRRASARSTRVSSATAAGSARTPTSRGSSRRSRGAWRSRGHAPRCSARAAPRARWRSRSRAAGRRVTVCARSAEGARAIARAGRRRRSATLPPRPGSWDVLVNATPVGSETMPGTPMGGAPLDGEIVFDLVYAPADTAAARRPRGGLPDDRRHRDARRAGRAAVRAVDGSASAGGALRGRGDGQ